MRRRYKKSKYTRVDPNVGEDLLAGFYRAFLLCPTDEDLGRSNVVYPEDLDDVESTPVGITPERWATRVRFPPPIEVEESVYTPPRPRETYEGSEKTPPSASIPCSIFDEEANRKREDFYQKYLQNHDERKKVVRQLFRSIVNRVRNNLSRKSDPEHPKITELNDIESPSEKPRKEAAKAESKLNAEKVRPSTIDPNGRFYFFFLFFVSLAYVYNLIAIPLRCTFLYHSSAARHYNWIYADFISDFIYMIDLIVVKPRVSFLSDGTMTTESKVTVKNYLKKHQSKLDLISTLPIDYFVTAPIFRAVRLLKWQSFFTFYALLDKILSTPLISRMARTLIYTFYLIHLNACAFYAMSDFEGIGSNNWVYSGEGNSYIRCLYFATKTSTSIGKLPRPENKWEFLYMTFAWLTGVCVFALLVGQVRNFIMTATKKETEYRLLLCDTIKCMRQLNVPAKLQKKVTSWYDYTWQQHHTLDDNAALIELPINLQTDVAIKMHIDVLSKVKLFTVCEEALLRDLVLKLRSVIHLPEDLICRKGDIGREMYILKSGEVEVMGGPEGDQVVATLGEGSVFGEISLMSINGINRRTADVRSKTFSNIFVLSKYDFQVVLQKYPEAQDLLMKRAMELIDINASRDKPEKVDKFERIGKDTEMPPTPPPTKSPKSPSPPKSPLPPKSDDIKSLQAKLQELLAIGHTLEKDLKKEKELNERTAKIYEHYLVKGLSFDVKFLEEGGFKLSEIMKLDPPSPVKKPAYFMKKKM